MLALAAMFIAILGTFADHHIEVGGTWGMTALLSSALSAWMVAGVIHAEPPAQRAVATVALGGLARRAQMEVELMSVVSVILTVAFVGTPLVMTLLGREDLFVRPVAASDILAASLGHLSSSAFGGAVGVLASPPRVHRLPTAALVCACLFGVSLLIDRPLGSWSGVAGITQSLVDAPPGRMPWSFFASVTASLVQVVLLTLAATAWARRAT